MLSYPLAVKYVAASWNETVYKASGPSVGTYIRSFISNGMCQSNECCSVHLTWEGAQAHPVPTSLPTPPFTHKHTRHGSLIAFTHEQFLLLLVVS